MLASMKSIIEAMAAAAGRKLLWLPAKSSGSTKLPWELWEEKNNSEEERTSSSHAPRPFPLDTALTKLRMVADKHAPAENLNRKSLSHVHVAALVVFEGAQQLADARVLRVEIARKLDRTVGLGGNAENLVPYCGAIVVLLTKRLIVTPQCVVEIYAAIRAGVRVITVLLDHGDYSFEDTRSRLGGTLDMWAVGESQATFHRPLAELLAGLSNPPDLRVVQKALYDTLTATIAVHWQPHAGPNHYEAVIADITAGIPAWTRPRRASSSRIVRRAVLSKEPKPLRVVPSLRRSVRTRQELAQPSELFGPSEILAHV
jgi:hypothetical protein